MKQAECSRDKHRLAAVGTADLDGVMLLAAIFGAEDMDAARLAGLHRQAGGDDGVERRGAEQFGLGFGEGDQRQAFGGGEGQAVFHRQHDGGRQKVRGFGQRDRGAVQIGRAVADRAERPFHRRAQIVGRVGHGADPGEAGLWRDHKPGHVAVIGAGLQRLGAPGGDGHHQITAHHAQLGEAGGVQRFGGDGDDRLPAASQHDRHAHAQVGAGAAEPFDNGGGKRHGQVPAVG